MKASSLNQRIQAAFFRSTSFLGILLLLISLIEVRPLEVTESESISNINEGTTLLKDVESDIRSTDNLDILRNLPSPKERIVGGNNAQPGAYPFFAQWMKGCGGSLVHDDIVLTAGHCLTNQKDFNYHIFVGGHRSASGYQRSIVDYVRHPRYTFNQDKAYDFLLLKLDRPVPNPQLVTLNQNPNYPFADEMFTVIGFGYTNEEGSRTPPVLQEVQVPHIPDCSQYYNKGSVQKYIAFCAGHREGQRDSCQADSGGALLNPKTNVQVGLVSWGRGCARPNSPGVYARVSTVYSWIQHQICETSEVPPAHCMELRVDVTMDDYPFEAEWALLDQHGHEMVVFRRGDIRRAGLTSTILRVPAGLYRFYMSDEDGICCSYGQGSIAIYKGSTTNDILLEHNGRFQDELVLSFNLQLPGQTSAGFNLDSSSESQGALGNPTTSSNQVAPSNQTTLAVDRPESFVQSNQEVVVDPGASSPVVPEVNNAPGFQVSAPGSAVSFTQNVANEPDEHQMNDIFSESTTLRIEIFYDTHPEETGWFLVNTDTSEELYTSKYDSNNRIPSNADKALTLAVEEFIDLEPGPYWFVIADAAMDGICCDHGEGYVRIVELTWSSYAQSAQRDHTSTTMMEEHVLWQHNGTFNAYAEAHFEF